MDIDCLPKLLFGIGQQFIFTLTLTHCQNKTLSYRAERSFLMNRKERTNEKMQELFHTPAAGEEGTDPEFMQILQGYIFGDVCYTGSLDNRMRELVTITVLTTIQALPQLKAHLGDCLNVGCTPVELREAIYQCAPFIGFPRALNAISVMNEVFREHGIELPLPKQGTISSSEERYEKGLAIQEPVYGTEIKERYTWLPGAFAEAVPRFLTELALAISIPVPDWTQRPANC